MSMSSISFNGRSIPWTDGDIELWLYALVRELDTMADPPRFLRDARKLWESEYSIGFGGAPDLHLDKICTSAEKTLVVIRLAEDAIGTLLRNPVFRKEDLTRDGVGGDFLWTSDRPAAGAIELGRACVELLRGGMSTERDTVG